MKENKGITMVVLVITIIILIILAGISVGAGNKIIKSSELENLKTNMLLIKAKGKEYVENANFDIGTASSFDKLTDEEKTNRINKAKEELKKGTEITITDVSEFSGNIGITEEQLQKDNKDLRFYYKLTSEDLMDIGISNVKSDDKNGLYIIKYDIKKVEVEVYNTQGFERDGNKYYSLSELQSLDMDL